MPVIQNERMSPPAESSSSNRGGPGRCYVSLAYRKTRSQSHPKRQRTAAILPLRSRARSRSRRRSSDSILLFCCASIACGVIPIPCAFIPIAWGFIPCGGMPMPGWLIPIPWGFMPIGPCGGGGGPAEGGYAFCPALSPMTYTGGSVIWRSGYCRTGEFNSDGTVSGHVNVSVSNTENGERCRKGGSK